MVLSCREVSRLIEKRSIRPHVCGRGCGDGSREPAGRRGGGGGWWGGRGGGGRGALPRTRRRALPRTTCPRKTGSSRRAGCRWRGPHSTTRPGTTRGARQRSRTRWAGRRRYCPLPWRRGPGRSAGVLETEVRLRRARRGGRRGWREGAGGRGPLLSVGGTHVRSVSGFITRAILAREALQLSVPPLFVGLVQIRPRVHARASREARGPLLDGPMDSPHRDRREHGH